MDLVWGPDLELTQTSTDIAKFLGSEKYEFCMNTIHAGLGVPAAIGRTKGSMSDNFMSLRVLMERLKYGRRVVTAFWEGEIRRVQRAMGFRYPAQVMYENMNLSDEVAEKALWIQLVDRDIVPVEAVQERFGRIPELDNILINREYKKREAGKMPIKVSPYVDAQPELSLEKIGLQRGVLTPSQVGLEDTGSPTEHEQELLDSQFPDPSLAVTPNVAGKPATTTKKKVGVSGQGRPRGGKDKKKRDKRNPKPSAKAEMETNSVKFMRAAMFAKNLQRCISNVVDPAYLASVGKTAIGDLSPDEGVTLEKYKYSLLCSIEPAEVASEEMVVDSLDNPLPDTDMYEKVYKDVAMQFEKGKHAQITPEDLVMIRSYTYATLKGNYNEEENLCRPLLT
jgi:hypothetical protein